MCNFLFFVKVLTLVQEKKRKQERGTKMRNLKITKVVLSLMLMLGLTTASFAMGPGDAKKAPKDNGKVKVEQKYNKKDAKVAKKDQHKKNIAKKNDKNVKVSKNKHNKGKHFAKKGHHKDYKFAKKHGHHKKHFAKKGHKKYFAKRHNNCRYY